MAILPVMNTAIVTILILLLKAIHTEIVERHVSWTHLGRIATICELLASIICAVDSEGRLGVNCLSPLEL